jgi:hypothetical protein
LAGRLRLAGIEREGDDAGDDSAVADWADAAAEVVVRDALVAWDDESGGANCCSTSPSAAALRAIRPG